MDFSTIIDTILGAFEGFDPAQILQGIIDLINSFIGA